MNEEFWRPVVGWEDLYAVSSNGRVWSVRLGDTLRPWVKQNGHLAVELWRDGRRKKTRIHHLVLEAFVGPRPRGMEACHWDDDQSNNNVSNLRWDTHLANMGDKARNRLERAA